MMYKCFNICPILPEHRNNCVAIDTDKWDCPANLTPTWVPLMTHLCNSCEHAGVCDTNDTDILYDNANVVECTYYEQGGRTMNLCDSCVYNGDVCFNDGTVPVLTCSCYDEEDDNE